VETTVRLQPTYTVIVRHAKTCPYKDKGQKYTPETSRCNCRKRIAVYNPEIEDPQKRQTTIKIKTRSWADAEQIAQEYRDSHDPDKRARMAAESKLKELQTAKELKTVTIEQAVARFIASKRAERVSEKRIERYLPLLGNVDPQTFRFRRNRRNNEGRLAEWLKTLIPRPVYISDLTPDLIEAFRNTWDFESDLTDFGAFGDLKRFFKYCLAKRWIENPPMASMKPPKVKRGNRTTAFSEGQYDSILVAVKNRYPAEIKTLEDQKRYDDTHRILAFIELMRWGGLALGDAVRFKLDSMKDNGQITYYRTKTKRRAQPRLVPHVVTLLKTTVPIDGDLNQPFYDKTVDGDTNAGYWSAELKSVFADAGIESVKTDIREREPHSHMLRDTFAINQLRTQYEEGHVNHQTIADALGDTVAIFLKHYAPWIAEFEQAHQDAQARITEAQAAKLAQKQASADSKITSIAGGRK
jgi:integrase/recombinase XerD